MSVFNFIKSLVSPAIKTPPAAANTFNAEEFIYLKIPGNIGPINRGELFEDKIDPVLAKDNLGSVSGGGSSLGDPRPDGSRIIEFCGIDIDTNQRDAALVALRELLPTLKAPIGTELHYTKNGHKLQDEFSATGWLVEKQRDFEHPGFGV